LYAYQGSQVEFCFFTICSFVSGYLHVKLLKRTTPEQKHFNQLNHSPITTQTIHNYSKKKAEKQCAPLKTKSKENLSRAFQIGLALKSHQTRKFTASKNEPFFFFFVQL
jgi:hypothetical protein